MAQSTPPPGFTTPPDFQHGVMRVWLIEPLGILTQLAEPYRADVDMARFLSGEVNDALFALPRPASQRLYFVHEWSNLAGYSTQARQDLVDWGKRIRRDIERLIVVLSPDTSPLVRMGINVASVAFRLVGLDLETSVNVREIISRYGIRPRRG